MLAYTLVRCGLSIFNKERGKIITSSFSAVNPWQKLTQIKLWKTHSLQHQRRTKGKVLVFRVTRKIMRLLSIVIQYIYQLLYSRIKLIEWTNLNKMEDKIFRLRMRPIIPMKIRLTFPLLHKQVNIFTYLGRLTLVSPEWSGYMIKNCFSVWGKY